MIDKSQEGGRQGGRERGEITCCQVATDDYLRFQLVFFLLLFFVKGKKEHPQEEEEEEEEEGKGEVEEGENVV